MASYPSSSLFHSFSRLILFGWLLLLFLSGTSDSSSTYISGLQIQQNHQDHYKCYNTNTNLTPSWPEKFMILRLVHGMKTIPKGTILTLFEQFLIAFNVLGVTSFQARFIHSIASFISGLAFSAFLLPCYCQAQQLPRECATYDSCT
jgi:hypothetical protein